MRSYADKYKNNGSLSRSYQVNTLGSSSDRESPRRVPRVLDEDTKYYIEKAEKYKRKNAELRSRLTIAETEVDIFFLLSITFYYIDFYFYCLFKRLKDLERK